MKANHRKLEILLATQCKNLSDFRGNGLSPQTLRRILRGEDVKPKTLGKLAAGLRVPVTDIIREEV